MLWSYTWPYFVCYTCIKSILCKNVIFDIHLIRLLHFVTVPCFESDSPKVYSAIPDAVVASFFYCLLFQMFPIVSNVQI